MNLNSANRLTATEERSAKACRELMESMRNSFDRLEIKLDKGHARLIKCLLIYHIGLLIVSAAFLLFFFEVSRRAIN